MMLTSVHMQPTGWLLLQQCEYVVAHCPQLHDSGVHVVWEVFGKFWCMCAQMASVANFKAGCLMKRSWLLHKSAGADPTNTLMMFICAEPCCFVSLQCCYRSDQMGGLRTGIRPVHIASASKMVTDFSGMPIQPHKVSPFCCSPNHTIQT